MASQVCLIAESMGAPELLAGEEEHPANNKTNRKYRISLPLQIKVTCGSGVAISVVREIRTMKFTGP